MSSMFDMLMELPLFCGVSRERMAEVVGSAKFHFLKYLPGTTILRAGDNCEHVIFIISGTVRMTLIGADGRLIVSQTLKAPEVISPDFLFGLTTTYPGMVEAIDSVGILRISKKDYIDILNSDQVFMFNFVNIISKNAQKSLEGALAISIGDIRERLALWVSVLTQPGASDIELQSKSRDLYALFGIQRSSFVSALEAMERDGLISCNADYNIIKVLDRKAFVGSLYSRDQATGDIPTE